MESELRRVAEAARILLPQLVVDPVEAARIDLALEQALALPAGPALSALQRALFHSHPALCSWAAEQLAALPAVDEEVLRAACPPEEMAEGSAPNVAARDRLLRGEPVLRHLTVAVPARAPMGCRVGVIVRITLQRPLTDNSAALNMHIPPTGVSVTITVSAPGLRADGDLEQDMHVPADGDAKPIRFGFRTWIPGVHTVSVLAFLGGTFLGEVSAQISVDGDAPMEDEQVLQARLEELKAVPGAAALVITRTAQGRLSFHLRSEHASRIASTDRLADEPHHVVEAIVAELCRMAAGTARFVHPADQLDHLENLGIRLWADGVPPAVRHQFWEQAHAIRSITIYSDVDIPWELLFPADDGREDGFLVERYPVLRRVRGQTRATSLVLRDMAFVVPHGSPRNAVDEVRRVRAVLGPSIYDRGTIHSVGGLRAFLASPSSVLHFSCHNEFSADTGSLIAMDDGPFFPADLARAVQRRSLEQVKTFVFLNACRTAGEVRGLTTTIGWARQFMGAGAGGFVGSLWAVRSSAAQVFAEAFYDAFVVRRLPLGPAVLHARRETRSADGDPTWLAYTVYGDPTATVDM